VRSDGQKTILRREWLPFILRFTLLPFCNHYLSLPPPLMASIQFIRLLSSSIGSSIESRRGRRDGDHSRENIGGVILLVGILIPRIYRMKIIKIVRVGVEGIMDCLKILKCRVDNVRLTAHRGGDTRFLGAGNFLSKVPAQKSSKKFVVGLWQKSH